MDTVYFITVPAVDNLGIDKVNSRSTLINLHRLDRS